MTFTFSAKKSTLKKNQSPSTRKELSFFVKHQKWRTSTSLWRLFTTAPNSAQSAASFASSILIDWSLSLIYRFNPPIGDRWFFHPCLLLRKYGTTAISQMMTSHIFIPSLWPKKLISWNKSFSIWSSIMSLLRLLSMQSTTLNWEAFSRTQRRSFLCKGSALGTLKG